MPLGPWGARSNAVLDASGSDGAAKFVEQKARTRAKEDVAKYTVRGKLY